MSSRKGWVATAWLALGALGCADPAGSDGTDTRLLDDAGLLDGAPVTDASAADGAIDDAGMPDDPCLGLATCDGILVPGFPFVDRGDTTMEGSDAWDGYSCAAADESGPEVVYVVDVEEVGLLGVRVEDGEGVDVDVHVLDAASPDACLERDDAATSAWVGPGRHYVVVDTYVAGGVAQGGEYTVTIRFLPVPEVDCATDAVDLPMFWSDCDPSLDCVVMDDGTGTLRPHLRTPAIGPVVNEAHLVTVDDGFDGWPIGARDGIEAHYALSEATTDFVARRAEPWAPAGEGGSMWGQGAIGTPLPTFDEGWYVNMYWRMRPAAGTRMLIRNPANGRTVVAAAGYETGPGANTSVAGVVEEVHRYLGTSHLDTLEVGFLSDPTAAFGPVRCR